MLYNFEHISESNNLKCPTGLELEKFSAAFFVPDELRSYFMMKFFLEVYLRIFKVVLQKLPVRLIDAASAWTAFHPMRHFHASPIKSNINAEIL